MHIGTIHDTKFKIIHYKIFPKNKITKLHFERIWEKIQSNLYEIISERVNQGGPSRLQIRKNRVKI